MESAAENYRRWTTRSQVRVKTCGKSARIGVVTGQSGKPHREQGQIGRETLFAPIGLSGWLHERDW